jgi:hypothetical protein
MRTLLAVFVLIHASIIAFADAFSSVPSSSFVDTYSPPDLSNRVAIVTGASRGTKLNWHSFAFAQPYLNGGFLCKHHLL